LVRAIAGADPISSGVIKIAGQPIRLAHPSDALDQGIVLVPEDRKAQGLILPQTIAENIAQTNYDQIAPSGWINPKAVDRFARTAIERFGVKGKPEQRVNELSGGNQQKVVIAKCISRNPRVVILDEPTRGIDVGARAAIYEVIAELACRGMAVVVVSSDLDEVLGIAHRVMVLSRGVNRGILDREKADRVAVMELATT
jgi:ribose transport system ATP-binding protein